MRRMDIALCGRALADSSATSACVAAPADRALAPDFLREIAGETGPAIGGTLYSDALSAPDGPAGTYIALMRHNAGEFGKALMP